MTKIEDSTARVAARAAAAEAATTERERMFHRRAHSAYRKLLVSAGVAEQRAIEEAAFLARTKAKRPA